GRNAPTPVGYDQATDWNDVAGGDTHTCARRMDGSLWCWGDNSHGALATDTALYAFKSTPTAVTGAATGWVAVTAGLGFTCAIDAAHHLWCAGAGGAGQLADGTGSHVTPARV